MYPNCTNCDPTAVEVDGTPTRDPYGPRGRLGASLAAYGDTVYLFGGYAYGGSSQFTFVYPTGVTTSYASLTSKYYLNDLWALDLGNATWTKLAPPDGYPSVPAPRHGHAAAMSIQNDDVVMIVFGGFTWDEEIGDMWQFNLSSTVWTQVSGEGTFPSRRTSLSMVQVGQVWGTPYGATLQAGRMLIWGGHGCTAGATYFAATKASAPALNTSLVAGIDLFVQSPSSYGEKFCISELADMWQYYPTSCPNDCSRRGTCQYNVCACEAGYTGTDCSNVTCPDSQCNFDYAGRTQVCLHCTGFGTCDGYTGVCTCNFPASGPSCAQLECLNACSGHGVCDHLTPNSVNYGTCLCDTLNGAPVYGGLDCSTALCNVAANSTLASLGGNMCNEGTCINGTCMCYPAFGDTLLFVAGPDGVGRIYMDANGTALPDGAAHVYRTDCGDLLFELSAARHAAAPASLGLLIAVAAGAWLIACS